MTAMRQVQRRNLLNRARTEAERVATPAIHALLTRRYKAVGRNLRRANLRKRLQKAFGAYVIPDSPTPFVGGSPFDLDFHYDYLAGAKQIVNNALFKADDGVDDWEAWGDMFTQSLHQVFADAVTGIYSSESKFWLSRQYAPGHVDPTKVVSEYQARTGRQIKQIADTTRDNVLQAITDWYKTDASLPELIDSLGQWFDEDRATRIARTEVSYIASQVSLDIYNNVGVKFFNVDLSSDPGPCPQNICPDQFDANPHPVGDQMPPYHVQCQCFTVPANEDGSVFI